MLLPSDPPMIASYRLGPVLGRGTQGEVYEALDTRTGLVVASSCCTAGGGAPQGPPRRDMAARRGAGLQQAS